MTFLVHTADRTFGWVIVALVVVIVVLGAMGLMGAMGWITGKDFHDDEGP
jgi:Na+/proline symporter